MNLEHTTIEEDNTIADLRKDLGPDIDPLLEIIERLDKMLDSAISEREDEVAALRTVIREQRNQIIKLES